MTLLVFRGEHVVSSRASVKEKRRRLIAPNWRFDDAIDTPNQKDRNGKQNDVASDFEDFSAQRGPAANRSALALEGIRLYAEERVCGDRSDSDPITGNRELSNCFV
jgi:hypothetical protein